jgi:small subunit ribosomal protein S13
MYIKLLNRIILPKKQVFLTLNAVYGVNNTTSNKICSFIGVHPRMETENIETTHYSYLNEFFNDNQHRFESNLRKLDGINIQRLINTGTYRGKRHQVCLPVRGQRTHTNRKTASRNKRRSRR